MWNLRANQDYPLPVINLFIKDDKDIGRLQLEKMVQELSKCHVRCAGYVAYITEEEKYDSLIDDWNENVHGLDFNNIETFLIYGENDYKFTSGGN